MTAYRIKPVSLLCFARNVLAWIVITLMIYIAHIVLIVIVLLKNSGSSVSVILEIVMKIEHLDLLKMSFIACLIISGCFLLLIPWLLRRERIMVDDTGICYERRFFSQRLAWRDVNLPVIISLPRFIKFKLSGLAHLYFINRKKELLSIPWADLWQPDDTFTTASGVHVSLLDAIRNHVEENGMRPYRIYKDFLLVWRTRVPLQEANFLYEDIGEAAGWFIVAAAFLFAVALWVMRWNGEDYFLLSSPKYLFVLLFVASMVSAVIILKRRARLSVVLFVSILFAASAYFFCSLVFFAAACQWGVSEEMRFERSDLTWRAVERPALSFEVLPEDGNISQAVLPVRRFVLNSYMAERNALRDYENKNANRDHH